MKAKKQRKWWIIPLILLVIVGAVVGGFLVLRNNIAQQRTNATAALPITKVVRGTLSATISATGTVRANQTAVISWGTPGKISQVKVAQGSVVKMDELMAALDPASVTNNSVMTAERDLMIAQRDFDNLKTSTTSKSSAQAALTKAQKTYDDAKRTRDNLNYARTTQDTVDSARASLYLAQSDLEKAQSRFDSVATLPETDTRRANALNSLVAAKEKVKSAQATLDWYLGKASSSEFSQADADLAVATSKLEDAQREWERLKNGPTQEDLLSAQVKINQAKSALSLLQLMAPFNGTITDLKSKVGDIVSNNTQAFRIDDLSALFADMSVSEIDIARVKVGQAVTITFDAIENKEYKGEVTEIDLVGISSAGTVNYLVTIQVLDADKAVKIGMTAAGEIVIDQVKDILLVPSRAIRTVGKNSVVYVVDGGTPKAVIVKVGLSSDSQTQVTSDELKENDVVASNPPANILTQGTGAFGNPLGGARPGILNGGNNNNNNERPTAQPKPTNVPKKP